MAETFALTRILPQIGFSELVHVSAFRRLVPFDIIGTFEAKRTLIDVTTCCHKGGHYLDAAISLANALGMDLLILFVKPDFKQFALKAPLEGHEAYCSNRDLKMVTI